MFHVWIFFFVQLQKMFPGASFTTQGLGFIFGAIIFPSFHFPLSSHLLIPSAHINSSFPKMSPVCPYFLFSSKFANHSHCHCLCSSRGFFACLVDCLPFCLDLETRAILKRCTSDQFSTGLQSCWSPLLSLSSQCSSPLDHCTPEAQVSVLFLLILFLPFTS